MIIQERRSTFLTLFNASCPLKRSYMLKQNLQLSPTSLFTYDRFVATRRYRGNLLKLFFKRSVFSNLIDESFNGDVAETVMVLIIRC